MAARRMAIPCVERLGTVLIEDVGVPFPQIPELLAAVAAIAARHRHRRSRSSATPATGTSTRWSPSTRATTMPGGVPGSAFDEVMYAALALGGTITGEHGVGSLKARHLEDQLGPDVMAVSRRSRRRSIRTAS